MIPGKNTAQDIRSQTDVLIGDFIKIAREYDPIELLARLAVNNLLASNVPDCDNTGGEPQLEYALSLFLASPFPQAAVRPSPDIIQHSIETLEQLYQKASFYYGLTSESKTGDRIETEIILNQRLQTLHVRGDAYELHLKKEFDDISSPHETFLRAAIGFGPQELRDFLTYIEQTAQDRQNAELQTIHTLYKRATEGEQDAVRQFQDAMDSMGSPSIFQVEPRNDSDRKILALISAKFGDNQAFLTKIPKWAGWPLNPTILTQKPIIEHAGTWYAFHLPFLGRNALNIVEGLIAQVNNGYWQNTFLKKRDDYVEHTAVQLVAGILKGSRVYQQLYYPFECDGEQRRAEVDGVIIYDDCLLIIEVKASGLSDASKRGAPDSIAADLKASLDKAYAQATRTLEFIRSGSEVVFTHENGTEALQLRHDGFRQTFLISVTRELFASLSTNLHLTRASGFIRGKEWPWAVCLNDLRVIAEFIDQPSLFLHYLVRRLDANNYPSLHTTDELDLFGRFLTDGLYCKGDEQLQKFDSVVFGGFSSVIDEYYHALELGQSPAPKQYPLPEEIRRFISILEQVRPLNFATAALRILGFDTKSQEKMQEGIPACEDAFKRRKGALCVMSTNDEGGNAIILGCVPLDTILEAQMKERALLHKCRLNVSEVILILWQPPLSSGNVRVYLL